MYKTYFQNLAEKENGRFYYKDETLAIGAGVRSPNVTYQVVFFFKGNKFTITNRTGTSFVGFIHCKLSNNLQPVAFEITAISHMKNFFLRRESRFVIVAKNENIKYFLQQNRALDHLSKIADKENFTPRVVCEIDETRSITTKYHLEFDEWTQVVEPIIELYKNLIDEFEKRLANISPQAYRENFDL